MGLAGHFDAAAVATAVAAAGGDAAVVAGAAVGPHDDGAAVAMVGSAGVDARAVGDIGGERVAFGAAALPVATDQHGAAAGRAAGVDAGAAGEGDAFAQHLDGAAGFAGIVAAGVERAGHGDHAAAGTFEHDDAVALDRGAGAHDAAYVEHGVHHSICRTGAEQHGAAVCFDVAAVADLGAQRGGVDRHVDEAARCEREGDAVAGGERYAAAFGGDAAGVVDLRREEGDVATFGGADVAVVTDGAGCAVAGEGAATGEEVGVGQAERGGDEAAYIDRGAGREIDAGRVDQVELAIGVETAEQLAGVAADDAAEQHRIAPGLSDVDGFAGCTAEAGPVHDGALAALVDVEHRRGRPADRHRAGHHLFAGGQGPGLLQRRERAEQRQHEGAQAQHRAVRTGSGTGTAARAGGSVGGGTAGIHGLTSFNLV